MIKTKLSIAIATFSAFAAASISAQENVSGQAIEDALLVEEVVVTGSRIATNGLNSPSPVQVVGSADIDNAGVANIQELLLKNPTFGSPTISRTNSNFTLSSAGVSTVDLRGLGEDRTLVLVDGRRFVSGVPGSSAVDMNVIPAQFLERVEIMTGGASSLYGSDAVAGVVNMVYKKDWEGVEFEVKSGESFEGDAAETQYNLTLGGNIDGGRGNVMVHAAYTDQGALYSADRDRSANDIASLGAYVTGNPDDFFTAIEPFYSSYSPQGRFYAGESQFTYDADNNLKLGFDTNGAEGPADGFNRNAYRTIAVPTERRLLASRGNYEITDGVNVFVEGTYASSQTSTRLEPFALASDDIYAVDGYVPIEFLDPNNPGSTIRNPLVADEIYNAAVDENGDGLKDIFFTRRMLEVGNRGNTADRDTFRVVTGFDADLAGSWSMDAYYTYGQTKEAQVSGGQVNVLNFRNALEVIADEDGNLICRDELAREQGCVAANIFGHGAMSQEALDYVTAPGMLATFVSQEVAAVNFTGELFDLPAGPIGMATGLEYREEFSRSEFDALQQAGLNAGNAIPREEGAFDVAEAYVEVNVPLLSGAFLAEDLSLRGAVRASDYSTVGSTQSWNFGVEWAPISDVRFRAISAQSTRAPNITELFSAPSQTYPSVQDPCENVTATSNGAISEACRADEGVMANIIENGKFTLSQSDKQGVSGYTSGNPELQEEVGKSLTVGAVITPDGIPVLEDFSFTVDYFNIEIEDAIVYTPRQFILDQCYNGGDTSYCDFITRRPENIGPNNAGSLEYVDTLSDNTGELVTEGVDLTVGYDKDLADFGLAGYLNAKLSYTHVLEGYTTPVPGGEKDQFAGEVGSAKDKFFLNLGYAIGDVNVAWSTSFIGKSYLDDSFMKAYGLQPETVGVDAIAYHDLNVNYTLQDKYELFAGIYNLTDEEPPMLITGLPGSDTGTETDAGTYDVIGRRYQVGFRVNF
ncbi:TonB-dependent receptor domain-containing protein [Microbulbifer elongatus]|uniref:TonB-dependent receptor domain-containing protein n=1 Tax=Microbulbifer elongatus TaxID=86173 RepID=UPI001CFE588C|nr:TonB-dependent receptor [Microbulbifer elongatus]